MATLNQKTEEILTPEMLESFLVDLSDRGRSQVSLQEYRRTLTMICSCFSLEDSKITAEVPALSICGYLSGTA